MMSIVTVQKGGGGKESERDELGELGSFGNSGIGLHIVMYRHKVFAQR